MPSKKSSQQSFSLTNYKRHLIPSTVGGGVAYILSGIVMLGLAVFAAVWVGNMISHHLHKK